MQYRFYNLIHSKVLRFKRNLFSKTDNKENFISGEELLKKKADSVKGIYMHVHKCAGTSLIEAFERSPKVISCTSRPGNFLKRTGRERIPDRIWENSYKFTFIRNPYARVGSAYLMFISSEKWQTLFPAFKDFVLFLKWSNVKEHYVNEEIAINDYIEKIDNIIHHCSLYHNPKYLLSEMDYIGKLETIEDDFKVLSKQIGLNLNELPHQNKSKKHYDYRDYYDAETRKIIYQIYQDDIERFGYSFDTKS